MSFLITRPDYDPTTRYLCCWSEKIIETARNKNKKIIDLKGANATKKELTGRIKKLKPALMVLNGHGNEDTITGQDGKTLIKNGENEDILHSSVTYAVSCSCGKKLGPESVAKGNSTFIGYDDEFVFIHNTRFLSEPLKDKLARPFMEASNQTAISLLKGHKAIEASNRSKDMFEKNCRELLSSEADFDALQSAKYLWWDKIHQVCLGNINATV